MRQATEAQDESYGSSYYDSNSYGSSDGGSFYDKISYDNSTFVG